MTAGEVRAMRDEILAGTPVYHASAIGYLKLNDLPGVAGSKVLRVELREPGYEPVAVMRAGDVIHLQTADPKDFIRPGDPGFSLSEALDTNEELDEPSGRGIYFDEDL